MKKPLWLKSNCISCPECGTLCDLNRIYDNFKTGYDCPRCKSHFSQEDFWADFEFKAGFNLDYGYNNIDTEQNYK